jgi:hypothetical protein
VETETNEHHFSDSSFYSCKILISYLQGVEEFRKSYKEKDTDKEEEPELKSLA